VRHNFHRYTQSYNFHRNPAKFMIKLMVDV
jgi:hypothetical protein